VCVGSAEQREDAIACDVLDGPPESLHDLTESPDRSADDLDDVFRVEFCGESGRPRDVGEQSRDGAPPAGDRSIVTHRGSVAPGCRPVKRRSVLEASYTGLR
jgi:hypothetical protein